MYPFTRSQNTFNLKTKHNSKIMKVNEKMAEINRLHAEIFCIEKQMEEDNLSLLITETLNLLNGVGKGYIAGDDYAPSRYYSEIEGVKNIRMYRAFDDANTYNVRIKCNSMLGVANVPEEGFEFKVDDDRFVIYKVYLSSRAKDVINY